MRAIRADKDHPGVAEVRRWRAAVMKKAGGTIEGLIQLMRDTPPAKSRTASAKRNGRSLSPTTTRRAATPRIRKGRA